MALTTGGAVTNREQPGTAPVAGQDRHPLDPLSADEINQVAAALLAAKDVGNHWRFGSIELSEPAKDELKRGPDGIVRKAQVVCWKTPDGQAYRAVGAPPDGPIPHWPQLPALHP